MNLNIKTIKNRDEVIEFVADSINRNLKKNKNIIWFVSGGSAIPLEVLISKKIKKTNIDNLTVTLVDERYGPIDYVDSNWLKLKELGFDIKGAKMIPFLSGKDMNKTVLDIKDILKDELLRADYKIGLFGIGEDGHTAGILPYTKASISDDFVCSYNTEKYNRITITPRLIKTLDEAVVYSVGRSKWSIIEKLKEKISVEEMPAQILKKVPTLTIFTDYSKMNR
jgi:6-phosphogluconolactonase/glucosamine-6-phosphate isomerase/deaminase